MTEEKSNKVEFFGEVDKRADGKLSSQYPAWFFENAQEELENSINQKQAHFDRGLVSREEQPEYLDKLQRDTKRLELIKKSRPNFNGVDKDKVHKSTESLGEKIGEAMPTLTDMQYGFASANEEAKRMVEPCIGLNNEEAELANSMGISMTQGKKISRNEAVRMWQILRKSLGNDPNPERLRRSGETSRRYIMR